MTTKRKPDERLRSIALSGIERQSEWLKTGGQQIGQYADMLASRPKYETRAEESLEAAQSALEEALGKIIAVRSIMRSLEPK